MKNQRRTIRLKEWDYSQEGVYFITVCTQNREHFFGEIVEGRMNLNAPGAMIAKTWAELPERFPCMDLDARILMPNHFHAIMVIGRRGESCIRPFVTPPENVIHLDQGGHQGQSEHKVRPYKKTRALGTSEGSIGRIVQAFKSITTHHYLQGLRDCGWRPFQGKLWQRNYFEHIIRDYEEWQRIHDYIASNPLNWATDRENREAGKTWQDDPWQV